ncbi:Tripartite ATP-independent periplasmic transporters, DctQ component [Rhodobacteraceae bacterium THAF1]|uniref:TRAP transporter small permease n=1 Tax=Palleronia sp. THAF1 TaxID=2587842 RepID=UPI000F3CDE0B|nr:TRAP transporter small permease subunit [Palleronia sp. THAF1]QFU08774.1 Tripartite ATP-independent periplasmic transporter, DctQ component [Palleronia sp. THAF1]VDC31217.1 Tripartite ATP-independent periplasmic transporters, DctQ component [Rhodobacteraceae bacterium THAF1]
MSSTARLAQRLARGVDMALLIGAGIALIVMMGLVSVDILSSLLLNAPISITSALVTNYAMIAVAFLPILSAERRGAHVGVTIVTDRLPEGARRGLETVVGLVTAGVYLLLMTQSLEEAGNKFSSGSFVVEQTTRILIWPAYFMVPIGFGAMGFLLLARSVLRLIGQDIPAEEPLEAPQLGESDDV